MTDASDISVGTFPRGFSEEQPPHWPMVRADSIVELRYGRALTESARRIGTIPVYGTNGRTGWHDEALSPGPGVILGRKGMGNLGVEWCSSPFWVIDTAYYTQPRTTRLDLRYFYYLISYVGLNHLKDGTSNPSLSRDTFGAQLLPLPPINEQTAIAATLSEIDDKIEQNRRTGAKLEGLARAVFKAWFLDFEPVKAKAAGATAFPGMPPETFATLPTRFHDTTLGPVPEDWEIKSLGALCTVGRGSSPRPINNFVGGTVPWLKIADATASTGPFIYKTKEFVTEAGATKSVAVAPGDLILSNSASCGIPMFVGLHGCIHDGWLHFRNLTQISKGFLFHFMQWKSQHLIHIADGSVQKNLNTKLINELELVVPPKEIHAAFAEMNDSMFLMIDALGRESAKLAALRDYLLPHLLSGRVRVEAGRD